MTTCTNCGGAILTQQNEKKSSIYGQSCVCFNPTPINYFNRQTVVSLSSINKKLDDILILLYKLKIDKDETTRP